MPYIQTRTNSKIDKEVELRIKNKFGEAIRILGKSEDWLMLDFVPECRMYYQGDDNELIAYVDIKIYGKSSRENYDNMTKVVTEIINQELGVQPDNIYVSYGEYDNWGWNGNNL